ncbi:DUF559 domain-containing protein [Nocardioides sp.]|uniref:DUF559 domain-containing protein n=1 Tax=Nocardioides sp. TaxID=35761 RepID=UPI0035299854
MEAASALERLGGVATAGEVAALSSRQRVRSAVARGEIVRLHRGRLALASAATARKDAAAVSGVVSHLSAALHWGWKVAWVPELVWVTVPRTRHPRAFRSGRVRLVFADLAPDQVTDGVTSPLRTVLDCAEELRTAAAHERGPGSAQSREVAGHATHLAANPFESVLRAIVLEFPHLRAEPQGAVVTRHRTYHPDLLVRRLQLALEADSWEFHTGKDAHARDCVRYTELTLAGWRVLRFTWEQVMQHPAYVREVLAVVGADRAA